MLGGADADCDGNAVSGAVWYVYDIDYEYGRAEFWSRRAPTDVEDAVWWERCNPPPWKKVEGKQPVAMREFSRAASHCFGIRKSLGQITLLGTRQEYDLPSYLQDGLAEMPTKGAATHYLTHNGDVILFDMDHETAEGDPWKLRDEHGNWCTCAERGQAELSCEVHHFWVPDHNKLCKCHMYQCRATTKSGARCTRYASSWHAWWSDYCPRHRSRESEKMRAARLSWEAKKAARVAA